MSVSTRLCLSYVGLAVLLTACSSTEATSPADASLLTGNGAPNGPHYNLNIIGVSNDKNPT